MHNFISIVMNKILEPVSERYLKDIAEASQMSAQEIYDHLLNECKIKNEILPINEGTIIFGTPGCSHNIRTGIHCGCSFCDWNDSYVVNPAYAVVLRRKSKELYQKMQSKTLEILRGSGICSQVFEEYAIHDCFDNDQISNEEIEALLSGKNFKSFPYIGLVQVRAESVTKEKIEIWKKGTKRVLTLGIGIETGNEWIRNHWLNKGLPDNAIMNAINIAHWNQCKVTGNLLMMIPGITLRQNLSLLVNSIKKLVDMGCDSVMLSPLVKKRYTIQNLLNERTNKYNIYYIIQVIDCLSKLDGAYRDKIMLSTINFMDFMESNFEETREISNLSVNFGTLLNLGGMKNFSGFIQGVNETINSEAYMAYSKAFEALDGIECLREQFRKSAHLLVTKLFDINEQKQLEKLFLNELDGFEGEYAEI